MVKAKARTPTQMTNVGHSDGKDGSREGKILAGLILKIKGKVYCTCKYCDWNSSPTGHTTGRHWDIKVTGYIMNLSLAIRVDCANCGQATTADTGEKRGRRRQGQAA